MYRGTHDGHSVFHIYPFNKSNITEYDYWNPCLLNGCRFGSATARLYVACGNNGSYRLYGLSPRFILGTCRGVERKRFLSGGGGGDELGSLEDGEKLRGVIENANGKRDS